MKVDLYNLKNEVVGTAELPDTVFGVAWKPALVKQVLAAQMANRREPWAHAKDRSEVSGGGKKPWRQKGTGRARHGSTRSPLWSGGGKAHGPRNDRDYSQKVNVKMKRLALFSVLSRKAKEQEVKVFDSLAVSVPKTREIAPRLRAMISISPKTKKMDILIIPAAENKNIFRAARNLEKVKVLGAESLNVYDALNYKHVFVDQEALVTIAKHYAVKK
jgi:large subunit ribosomal protein L4